MLEIKEMISRNFKNCSSYLLLIALVLWQYIYSSTQSTVPNPLVSMSVSNLKNFLKCTDKGGF